MLARTAVVLALAGIALARKPEIEIVAGSAIDRPFAAVRDESPLRIESRKLQIRLPSMGRIETRELVLFREISSGYSLYLSGLGDLLSNTAVSINGNTMRAFSFGGLSLYIQAAKGRYASLDEVQHHALADLAANLRSDPMTVLWSADGEWVRMVERLPHDLVQHFADTHPPATRLSNLKRSAGCWSMTIDGPGVDPTQVTLDDQYDITDPKECGHKRAAVSHVRTVPESRKTVTAPVIRDNQPATIELHFQKLEMTFPDGRKGPVSLFLFYDPRSHLSWWNFWESGDAGVEEFLKTFSLYETDRQIVGFSTRDVRESTERYPDFESAEAHAIQILDQAHANLTALNASRYRDIDSSGIPRDYFHQCGHAEMGVVQLKAVSRSAGLWRLTLTGPNGNVAVLSLNDAYETVGVKLSPEVPPEGLCGVGGAK